MKAGGPIWGRAQQTHDEMGCAGFTLWRTKSKLREGCCRSAGKTGEAEGRGNWGRESWGSAMVVGLVCGPCLLPPPPAWGPPYLTAASGPQLPALPSCRAGPTTSGPGPTGERRGAGAELPDWFARPGPTPLSPGVPAQSWCSPALKDSGAAPAWHPRSGLEMGATLLPGWDLPEGLWGPAPGRWCCGRERKLGRRLRPGRGKMQSQVQMPVFPGPAV